MAKIMTNEEITERLFSKKSSDRRIAAKEIGKNKLTYFGDELYINNILKKKRIKEHGKPNVK
jgi:hypothetical protein